MNVGESQQFNYNGGVQSFTAPYSGIYKLEVYGCVGSHANAGKGGYSKGYKKLKKGDVLYIVCGGQPYNGGGNGYGANIDMSPWGWDSYDWDGVGPGGGATHIATTNRGVLSNYNSYRSEVLIVAGGGGGADDENDGSKAGGTGGGLTGGSAGNAGGGTQTSGYAFGQGAQGAGGGWYGGYYHSDWISGGGSGYIGGVDSFNGDSPSSSNGVNGSSGYAIVTLMKKISVKVGNDDCDVYIGSTQIDSIYIGTIEL